MQRFLILRWSPKELEKSWTFELEIQEQKRLCDAFNEYIWLYGIWLHNVSWKLKRKKKECGKVCWISKGVNPSRRCYLTSS